MNGAFYIAATGLDAQQRALDVIANNVANINTTAFKRSDIRFSELVASLKTDPSNPNGQIDLADALSGVSASASGPVFVQGTLQATGQPTDLAISGDGFIELMGPGGQALLWRGGSLKINADGYLAADNGMALKALISVPVGAGSLTIGLSGQVTAQLQGQAQQSVIGQIDLVMPKDPTALQDTGAGLFATDDPAQLVQVAPGQEGSGTLTQGSLEASNVQLSDQMVEMLLIQRAYAANAQVVQAGDQLMSIANQLRR